MDWASSSGKPLTDPHDLAKNKNNRKTSETADKGLEIKEVQFLLIEKGNLAE